MALGSLGLTVLLCVQSAIMEPWLADVLNRRTLGYAAPTAPTELLALVVGVRNRGRWPSLHSRQGRISERLGRTWSASFCRLIARISSRDAQ